VKNIIYRFQKRIAASQIDNLFKGIPVSKRPPQTPKTLAAWEQVITAWHKGRLVGVAAANGGRTVNLGWLYVHESYRRKGIGTQLVEKLIDKFPNAQAVKLIANRAVLDFYKECGFTVRKDAVPMIKELKGKK
jgi:GNAT superfamily N-acetyltransferase